MGTTAQKLTYLNDTKQLLKENINNLGGNLTTEPFRQYTSVLEGIYESLPKVSGIGASLSLSPSMVGKIKLNEIQGNTLQENTPTPDTPVPIQSVTGLQNINVCGKNLFNLTGETHGSNVNVTQTGNEFEITWTGGYQVHLDNSITNLNTNKTYTISFLHKGDGLIIRNSLISTSTDLFSTGSHNDYEKVSFNVSNIDKFKFLVIRQAYTNGTAYIKDIQLEQGSNATTYEPYKGNTYEVNLGKNLLDASKGRLGTFGTLTISYSNGEILLNGTSTSNVDFYVATSVSTPAYNNDLINYMNNNIGSYTLSNNLGYENYFRIGGSYPQNTGTTTSTNKVDLIFVRIPAGTYNNKTLNIQIEKGSQATSYSPYFTPIELNKIGDYEDSIKKSTGKNLFDKDNANIVNGFISDGGTLVSDNVWKTLYIPCKPNTTYTVQKISGKAFRVADFTNVPVVGASYISRTKNDTATSITFTTSSTGNYLAVSYIRETDTLTNQQILDSIMINEGTALPYEPYGKVWYITENIGKVVLNGTQTNPEVNTSLTNTTRVFYNYALLDNNSLENYGLCNQLVYNSNWSKDEQGFYLNNNDKKLIFRMNKSIIGTTVNEVNTYLSSHNLIVYYVQATPTYTVITNTELIEDLETLYNAKSKDGTTNINVTSEDLSMLLNVGVLKGDAE